MGAIREMFNNAVEVNNANNDVSKRNAAKTTLMGLVVGLIIIVLLQFVLAPWLWNNILSRAVPGVGQVRWYDVFLLSILTGLVFPHA